MYRETAVLLLTWATVVPGTSSAQQAASPDEPPMKAGSVRVVRFHVKANMAHQFEAFFWESFLPAARMLSSEEELAEQLNRFHVLRPAGLNSDSALTYYVIWETRPDARDRAYDQNMRQLVREAFSAEDAQRRIGRWMESIDLEKLVPVGATFRELDFAGYLDER